MSGLRSCDIGEAYFLNLIAGVGEFAVGLELFADDQMIKPARNLNPKFPCHSLEMITGISRNRRRDTGFQANDNCRETNQFFDETNQFFGETNHDCCETNRFLIYFWSNFR
jgi:hypothetical protein